MTDIRLSIRGQNFTVNVDDELGLDNLILDFDKGVAEALKMRRMLYGKDNTTSPRVDALFSFYQNNPPT